MGLPLKSFNCEKSPCLKAIVGTVVRVEVAVVRKRNPSKLKKKNALSLPLKTCGIQIGPPASAAEIVAMLNRPVNGEKTARVKNIIPQEFVETPVEFIRS